ncbi:MAG: insulinase family protein [Vicinamibacterales bacterium]
MSRRQEAGGRRQERPALAMVALLPFVLSAAIVSAQNVPWPTERMPRPLPAKQVTFPPYDIRTLSNGMQVVTVLHHEQPAVSMRLLVRAGGANDPDKKRGVSLLVTNLLDQGTTTRSSQQIADQIDSIGGVLGTGSGDDFTSISAIVMKDSFDLAMDMVADIARNPAFAPEEIERQKEQVTSTQQVNANDPDYIASAVFDRLVYGFHPYGLPGSGTPETIASITRDDLRQFHRQHFVPNNMVLAIVGDITQKEAVAAAERAFGSWPRGEASVWRGAAPPEPTRRIIVVDKPDAVQTEIRVGQLAIPRKHQDYLKWDLAIKVLGGEGANRLHRVLRSERGLTYGASADTEGRKLAGDIVAETDTRTDTTVQALRLMVQEFTRLQQQRVPERELMDAQAYLAGSFPLTIESPNDIATQVINYVLYELPLEDIPTYTQRVTAITPDDIQRVAQAYLKPDRLSVVLVGNAKAFVPQLRDLGLTDIEVIPVEQLDLMSASLKRETGRRVSVEPFGSFESFESFGPFAKVRPAYQATQVNPRAGGGAPNASALNDRAALDLLRRVVDARGGLMALKGIRTIVAETNTTFQMQQGTLPSTTRTYIVYPDKFRVDAEINGAQTTQVFNAGTAWVKNPAGVQDGPPGMAADFAASVRRDIIPLLIDAAEGRLTVRQATDQAARDGRPVQVLEISGPKLDRVRLFIDQQMLIVGQAYTITLPGPQPRTLLSEEVFSDYRFVSGIRVPFETQLMQNGQAVMKRTITKVSFNEPIPDNLFIRPSQ